MNLRAFFENTDLNLAPDSSAGLDWLFSVEKPNLAFSKKRAKSWVINSKTIALEILVNYGIKSGTRILIINSVTKNTRKFLQTIGGKA